MNAELVPRTTVTEICARRRSALALYATAYSAISSADNAHRVGWHYMPEYCFGRPTAKFVSHDHRLGTFTYVN